MKATGSTPHGDVPVALVLSIRPIQSICLKLIVAQLCGNKKESEEKAESDSEQSSATGPDDVPEESVTGSDGVLPKEDV